MTDDVAEAHSATSIETTDELNGNQAPTFCEAFSSPEGNVVFLTSDNVIFRVEDFYLKANSGLFRDMLCNSIASISLENPLPVAENARDFEIMLSVIVGKPEDVIYRPTSWEHSARLYRLVSKYQLEGHRYWFSQMCSRYAADEPWEAILLACNQSPLDISILAPAISQGLSNQSISKLCDKRYFDSTSLYDACHRAFANPKEQILDASNISILFGRKLGHIGVLAYTRTFSRLASSSSSANWDALAQRFIANIVAIETANRQA